MFFFVLLFLVCLVDAFFFSFDIFGKWVLRKRRYRDSVCKAQRAVNSWRNKSDAHRQAHTCYNREILRGKRATGLKEALN